MKIAASYHDRVQAAAQAAAARLDCAGADVGVVLGSGLAAVGDRVRRARSVPYAALPGFPETSVAGHPGRMVAGTIADRGVLVLCGRVHAYEGYAPSEVGFGVRVLATLGVGTVIVTNVSGGVDPALTVGEIAVISDHINLTGLSPLVGPNDERLGPRFLDMTEAYGRDLRAVAAAAGKEILGAAPREAIYAGMLGPSYETPAEVRMLRGLGAGLVGMSTVHEVIAARHAGLRVLGLSLVANAAAGVGDDELCHEDVTRAAAAGAERMGTLIEAIVARLPRKEGT